MVHSHWYVGRGWVGVLGVAAVALMAVAITPTALAEERDEVPWSRYPEIGIPLLGEAPQIDGQVGDGEWARATRLPPLLSSFADGFQDEEETNEIYVGYTAEGLYIGWRVHREAEVLYRHDEPGYKEGRAVWGDDHIELFLDVGREDHRSITFVGNPVGAYGDGTLPPDRGGTNFDPTWAWDYAARETDFGWEAELHLPFDEVGMDSPEVGDVMGVEFWRNVRSNRRYWTELALSQRRQDRFPQLVFLGESPAARVLSVGTLDDEALGVEAELVNPTAETREVEVTYAVYRRQDRISRFNFFEEVDSGLDDEDADEDHVAAFTTLEDQIKNLLELYDRLTLEQRVHTVGAGESLVADWSTAPSPAGDYLVAYRAVDDEGRVLFSGMTSAVRWNPIHVETTPYYLHAEQLDTRISVHTSDLIERARRARVAVHQRGEVVSEQVVDMSAAGDGVGLDVASVTPGDYHLQVTALDESGQTLAETEQVLQRPEPPFWATQQYGLASFVPEPWTPVEAEGNTGRVWGREYVFEGSFLPAQIISQGEPLFASPPRLVVTIDGEDVPLEGSVELIEHDVDQAVWAYDGHAGELAIDAKTRLEFDGFLMVDFKIDSKGTTIDRLFVEFPMLSEHADNYQLGRYFNTLPGASDDEYSHGVPGTGDLDESFEIGFNHRVWIGGPHRGMEWTTETAEFWSNEDRGHAIEVDRGPRTTLLRLRVIDRPEHAERMAFQWGLAISPVRPYEGASNGLYVTQRGSSTLDLTDEQAVDEARQRVQKKSAAGANWLINFSNWNRDFAFGQPFREVEDKIQGLRNLALFQRGYGVNQVFYTGWNGLHPNMEMWPHYGEAMRNDPSRASYGGYKECTYGGYIEYLSGGMVWMYENLGSQGVYLDGTGVKFCRNPYHGCGFNDPETGDRIADRDIFGRRELFKRLYKITHGELMDHGIIYSHAGGALAMEAFVSIRHTGEGGSWDYYTNVERYRASNNPVRFGIPIEHAWRQHHPVPRNLAWGMALIHDNRLKMYPGHWSPDHLHMRDHYRDERGIDHRMWVPLRWFDWASEHAWYPYYENAEVLETGGEEVYASFRVNDRGQMYFYALNLAEADQQVDFRFDIERLGLPGKLHARDAVTHETFEIEDGAFTLEILGHRPRVLMINVEPVPHIESKVN
ncbi:MAG: glycoside hydrolase domain-containing protein [Phycisphaeraceae bacterium]